MDHIDNGAASRHRPQAAAGRRRGAATVEMAVLVLPLAAVMPCRDLLPSGLAGTADMNAPPQQPPGLHRWPAPRKPPSTRPPGRQANLAGHARTCNPLSVTVDTQRLPPRRGRSPSR